MWLFTKQEAKEADLLTQASGTSEELLMERAGIASAEQIIQKFRTSKKAKISVAVFCGPGHNGGDGLVLAQTLLSLGWQVQMIGFQTSKSSALRRKKESEFKGSVWTLDQFYSSTEVFDIWVDALFGTGLNRDLPIEMQNLIQQLNQKAGFKVSLDCPTGLDAGSGKIFGRCFKADLTLAVERPKTGFFLNRGPEHCGQIRTLKIGFSKETLSNFKSCYLLSRKLTKRWIPERLPTDHKGKGGRSFIWAGSRQMPGACILAGHAAARVGAGYIYVSEIEALRFLPEAIPLDFSRLSEIDSALIGPGLGVNPKTLKAIQSLKSLKIPVVIDADALTILSQNSESLLPLPQNWIATPHAGELSRILGISTQEIEADRLTAARLGQKKLGCILVLKGFHTVIALAKLSLIINTGNVALAKGGSGDVLAGMITGFLAQGVMPERAALLASYVHGLIADQWIQTGKDLLSLMPSDLLETIPQTLAELRKS